MDMEKTWRIGEVAEMLNLKTYVLRFWETEFPQLAPTRAVGGQRLYTNADIELVRRIQNLLHEQGLTIEGARRVISGETIQDDWESGQEAGITRNEELLNMVEKELEEIAVLLEKGACQ